MKSGIWRLLFLCVLVGIVAGLGAIAFYTILSASKFLFFDLIAGYHPMGPGGEPSLFPEPDNEFKRWMLLFLPAIGGLLSGILVFRVAPEAEGHGTDAAIDSYLNKSGIVRARVPIVKIIASALTIGSGGSAGREGPIAQIGSGFGSMLATWLGLNPTERRVLLAAGMGAGIGAIFHAPLAGSLFAAEVLYRELDLEYEVIMPTVISSIIAYGVFAMQFGWDPLFITPDFRFENPMQLLPYGLLAVAVSGGAWLYTKSFYGVRDLFAKLNVPNVYKPAIGGAVVGIIGFFLPGTLGAGYGILQNGFTGQVTIGLFLAIALGKIVTTSFSVGSGGSGGVFGPAVVIGGAMGGAVGVMIELIWPGIGIQTGAFVLVGMAGFFAAAANTPISTIIMVSEMTGNYHLLVPSMWVCFLAYAISKSFGIYEKQALNRLHAPAHMGEMMDAILRKLKVADAIQQNASETVHTVRENYPAMKMIELFSRSEKTSLPVVNEQEQLIGQVDGRHLRSITSRPDLCPILVASDLTVEPATVSPEHTLLDAIQMMAARGFDEVIVVDPIEHHKILAILSRGDIVASYYRVLKSDMTLKSANASH